MKEQLIWYLWTQFLTKKYYSEFNVHAGQYGIQYEIDEMVETLIILTFKISKVI